MLLVAEANPPPRRGGGGFADYAVVSLHCLRIYLEKSYREALDLLSEMPQMLAKIGLDAAALPDHSMLVEPFDRIKMWVCRVLLRLSAQLHEPSGHVAIDATFFDHENASKYNCRRTNYRVQTPETTGLVDTASQAVLDVHCTTEKRHETQIGGNSPAAMRASCTALPPIKAMIGNDYVISSGKEM